MVGADHFVEVFVDTPLEVCEQRDAKGSRASTTRTSAHVVAAWLPRGDRRLAGRRARLELEPTVSTDYSISDLDEKLAQGLHESGVAGIVSAYLFGSHARGAPHRESDVDVGVLLARGQYPDAGVRFDVRVRLSSELLAAVHRDVDVVILNDAPPMLGRRIVSEGHRIFCLDPAADHDFVVYTLIRAADLDPWYRRYAKIKLEAIRR